jgi:hypothetical protein
MPSKQLPVIKDGELVKKKLTGKLVLRGTCPACDAAITMTENEVLKNQNACTQCGTELSVGASHLSIVEAFRGEAVNAKQKKELEDTDKRRMHEAKAAAKKEKTLLATQRAKQASQVIVTTGDLKEPYEIIRPVYFQVSNKGIFSSSLATLMKKYEGYFAQLKQQGQIEGRIHI